MNPFLVRLAATFGFLGVALGAFGAHLLKGVLAANATTAIREKAVLYHLLHSVVLLVLALRPEVKRCICFVFAAGIVLFSGSLYLLAVTNIRTLGRITPFGGGCLLVGWGWLIWKGAAAK